MKRKQKKIQAISTNLIIIADIILVVLLCILFFFYAKRTGTANLENLSSDAEAAVTKCKNASDWRACYGYKLSEYLKKDSLEYAMKVLEKVETIDPQAQRCHVIAHKLAAAEMEKDPSKWRDLVKRVDQNFCNYGFIHGVIEARSRFEPGFAVNEKSIGEICDVISKGSRIRGTDQSCSHIMGHVLLADKEGDIAEAVGVCDKIKSSLEYQCNSGIFMENFTRDNLVAHGVSDYVPWNDETIDKQEALCRKYKDTVSAKACWMEVSHLYNNKYPFQPENVYKLCSRAPNKKFVDACYIHAVGTLMENKNADNAYLVSLCAPYTKDGNYYECLGVVVNSYINSSLRLTGMAFDYCANIPDKFRPYCYEKIGKLLGMHVSKTQVAGYCKKAPSEYQNGCNNPGEEI